MLKRKIKQKKNNKNKKKNPMKTSVFDWGKPLLKAIDRWWSAYANAVIPELVRIIITYARQTEKQKDCNADVTWSGSSWKTSSVWIYGHQYHVILAEVFILVFLKNFTCTSFFFSTIRFCYRIKIFYHFISAKHKATESFLFYLLNKPFSKINWIFFCVESLFDCKTLP